MKNHLFKSHHSFHKPVLLYYSVLSFVFVAFVSVLLIFGTYKLSYFDSEQIFEDTYQGWLSEIKHVRFSNLNHLVQFSYNESLMQKIRELIAVTGDEGISLSDKKAAVDLFFSDPAFIVYQDSPEKKEKFTGEFSPFFP